MQLDALVAASAAVAATRSRLAKRDVLAACLRDAADAHVLVLAVHYLCGTLPQGRIGLGPAIVHRVSKALAPAIDADATPANARALTLTDINAVFDAIAAEQGAGSQGRREAHLREMLSTAQPDTRSFLVRLMLGELRQGALDGVLADAVAAAADVPADRVRRAAMLAGELPPVAAAAIEGGVDAVNAFRLVPLKPIQPMLAKPAEDAADAVSQLGRASVEVKIDGARIQLHRQGDEVRIFTRQLNDVTDRLPEVVEAALALSASSLILDGEVLGFADSGRPLPFQVTMRRFGRKRDVDAMRATLPLYPFYFDCLHLNGEDLIDHPLTERQAHMRTLLPDSQHVPAIETDDPATAETFFLRTINEGHEGVMLKSLLSPYAAGSRGGEWLKLKQVHTFDLVVLGAEWGSGRRRGFLSNLHLGARDGDDFVMLGKTFKGLTDAMLATQTEALLARETHRDEYTVYVRPELVVEIAVNEIQASRQYPAGMALRFARVKAYRDDKQANEADTVDAVRALFDHQRGVGV